ncbi:hypothetical protein [Achromobacter insuavis]|uniref:hypothetical protein n=1 Tax=Achromobacter insuavis TaxID=1287735 RepID=UPI001EEDEEDB|nr:hypothetical protein [Achromobacter insuavis]
MNASPNLTDPYDPMAGTLARTAMQCQARGCDGCLVCRSAGAAQVVQEPHKTAGGAGAAPASFARAAVFQGEPFPPLGEPEHGTSPVPDVPGNVPALNVNILALDLGTKLGWALQRRGRPITHGTESFAPRKSWSPGQRWQRFRTFLHEVVAHNNVHVIAYEDVKRHAGTDAAHAYGAFLALTELVADSHRVRLVPVGVGTIKKHWTGKGNADKAAMEAQARARGFRPESDNDADALAILHWAVTQERKA